MAMARATQPQAPLVRQGGRKFVLGKSGNRGIKPAAKPARGKRGGGGG